MNKKIRKTNYKDISVVLLVSYFILGIGISLVSGLDIFPPCLWKTLFDINCPGCGLVRASVQIAKFEFIGAWNTNPIIYLVVPFFSFETFGYIKSFISKDKAK
jgi:hypothetical protein